MLSPHFSRHQNTFYLSFLPSSLSFCSFHASRIGTCRIHAHLINDIFNLTVESTSRYEDLKDERDSARRENQTLKKEIKELKKKRKDYQGESQPLQKNLQFFSWKLEPANEEQQQKMGQPQGKYKELEDKVTNRTPELKELPAEIMQHRGE